MKIARLGDGKPLLMMLCVSGSVVDWGLLTSIKAQCELQFIPAAFCLLVSVLLHRMTDSFAVVPAALISYRFTLYSPVLWHLFSFCGGCLFIIFPHICVGADGFWSVTRDGVNVKWWRKNMNRRLHKLFRVVSELSLSFCLFLPNEDGLMLNADCLSMEVRDFHHPSPGPPIHHPFPTCRCLWAGAFFWRLPLTSRSLQLLQTRS